MKLLLGIVGLLIFTASSAAAMDTKAAGRCLAFSTMVYTNNWTNASYYRAKADAIWASAIRTGYIDSVTLSVDEELAYLNAHLKLHPGDQVFFNNWAAQAVFGCQQF